MIRIFNISFSRSVLLLLLSEILLLFACYVAAAFVAPLYDGGVIYLFYDGGLGDIAWLVLVVVLGLYLYDLYDDRRITAPTMEVAQDICLVLGGAFLLQAILGYGKIDLQLPKWLMIIGSSFVLVAAPLWRKAYSSLIRTSLPRRKLMFWGISPTSARIIQGLEENEMDSEVLGYIDSEPKQLTQAPYLGTPSQFAELVQRTRPDCIVIGLNQELPVQQLVDLRFSGITVEDAAVTYETVFQRVSTTDLRPSQMIFSSELSPSHWNQMLQNFYSWMLALMGLVLALPVMLLVVIAVKATSKGPVFFRQKRVGLNGAPFFLFKFRSMRANAEADTGPVWAQKNDPRVTSIGGWLRRTRLDELPQFINVLRGEMSMVGPRPERPEFVTVLSETIPFYNLRHCVKPGITGWAQINHKYGDTIADTVVKLEYDLHYIKSLSPALDLFILFQTAKVVLLQRGSQ